MKANPSVHKKFVLLQHDWRIYTVDAFAIRNLAQPDEEFTSFATQEDFPNLIPEGEVWIARQNFEVEGLFFLANAMAQLKQRAQGLAKDQACDSALQIERPGADGTRVRWAPEHVVDLER